MQAYDILEVEFHSLLTSVLDTVSDQLDSWQLQALENNPGYILSRRLA
jgi:hypothetical protein